MFDYVERLRQVDPELWKMLASEARRQHSKLELIASENFVPGEILLAMGSPLQNKYAEGYPGKRYYGGCEFVDIAESLAIERAKKVFGADHANVQPHAGAQANLAVYFAFLKPGDTYMGLALDHGGHLTHGHPITITGKWFNVVQYRVHPETHLVDFDYLREKAREVRPKLIMAGASAYPRAFDWAAFREICDEVGAILVADIAHYAGLVAAGLYPNPFPHADVVTTTVHKTLRGPRSGIILCKEEFAKQIDRAVFPGIQGGPMMHVIAAKAVALKIAQTEEFKQYQRRVLENARAMADYLMAEGFSLVSGGTDCHLLLVDVKKSLGRTGKWAEERLDPLGITVNKNTVPYDTEKPFIASGIRLGSPALTARGFGREEFVAVSQLISKALKSEPSEELDSLIRGQVRELCERFPLYQEWWQGEKLAEAPAAVGE